MLGGNAPAEVLSLCIWKNATFAELPVVEYQVKIHIPSLRHRVKIFGLMALDKEQDQVELLHFWANTSA